MNSLPDREIMQNCPLGTSDRSQDNCKKSKTGWFFTRKVRVVMDILPKVLYQLNIDTRQRFSGFFNFIITVVKTTTGLLFSKKNRDTQNPERDALTGDVSMPPHKNAVKNSLQIEARTEGPQSPQLEQTARTLQQVSVKDNAFNSSSSFQDLLPETDNLPEGHVPLKPEVHAHDVNIEVPVEQVSEIKPPMIKDVELVTVSDPSSAVTIQEDTPCAVSEVGFSVTDQNEEPCERDVSKKPGETVQFQVENANGVVAQDSKEVKVDSTEVFEMPDVSPKPVQISQASKSDAFSEVEKLYSELAEKTSKTKDYKESVKIRDDFISFIESRRHILKNESVDRKLQLRNMLFQLVGHFTLCSSIEGQHKDIKKTGSKLALGLLVRDYFQIKKTKEAPYNSTCAPNMLGCSDMSGRNDLFQECFLIVARSKGDIQHDIDKCSDRFNRKGIQSEASQEQLNQFKTRLEELNNKLLNTGMIDLDECSRQVEEIASGLVMEIAEPHLKKYTDKMKGKSADKMAEKVLKRLENKEKATKQKKGKKGNQSEAEAIRKNKEFAELKGYLNGWFERPIENSENNKKMKKMKKV